MKINDLNEKIKELMVERMNAKKRDASDEEIKIINTALNVVKSIKDKFVNFDKGDKASNMEIYGSIVLDEQVENILLQEMKRSYEKAIEKFEEANAQDLVAQNRLELAILATYMPKQPTEEEIAKYVEEILDGMENVTMSSTKEVLAKVKDKYPDTSGKLVSSIVRKHCM